MPRLDVVAVAVVLTSAVLPAVAAGAPSELVSRAGLSVAFVPLNPVTFGAAFSGPGGGLLSSLPLTLGVPLAISPNVRLEPGLAILNVGAASDDGSGSTSTSSTWIIQGGFGLYYIFAPERPVHLYVGPRLGLQYLLGSSNSTSPGPGSATSTETTQVNIVVGATLGAEVMISPHFAVAGEGLVTYLNIGNPTTTITPATPRGSSGTRSAHLLSTDVVLVLRFFF